jgi:integrase
MCRHWARWPGRRRQPWRGGAAVVTLQRLKVRASSLRNRANAAALHTFIDEERHRVELSTINSRMDPLLALGRHLGRRGWKACTKADVVHVIANHVSLQGAHLRRNGARGEPLADSTKYQWVVLLMVFYKWLLDTDERPPQFRRLPFRKIDATAQRIKVLCLTPEEVRKLLAGAKSKRDRAIVIVALEGRFRASEMAALRLDGVEERNHGFWLELDEAEPDLKTGVREVAVPIVAGQSILREWLNDHPLRHEKKPPLFVTQSNRSQGRRMTGSSISAVIQRCAKRAKLRRVHAHMLRHTGTSFAVARKVNPEVIRLVGGWTKKSTMLQYYTHVREAGLFESMALEAYGLKSEEHAEILDVLGSQPCLLCGEKVDITTQVCAGCGITNSQAMMEAQHSRQEEAAVNFVAIELATALGWEAKGPDRVEAAVAFLRGEHEGADFVRWCLAEWATRCANRPPSGGRHP